MKILTFKTRNEAFDFINKFDKGIYELRYGEYARPNYKVRKIRNKNEYGIRVEYFFYSGVFNAKKDGFLTLDETYYFLRSK